MDIEDNEELENGGEGAVQDGDNQEKEFRVVPIKGMFEKGTDNPPRCWADGYVCADV